MAFGFRATLAALVLGAIAAPAFAADLPSSKGDPIAPTPSFVTFDPFQIRLRVVDVAPTSSNNSVYTVGGAFVGKGLTVQSQVIPELDVSYYFTPNIAVEAICCFSYHSIKAVNALSALGTVGNTWVFPPTVLLQYHFTNFGAFQPYVGIGVNYTHYFNTKATGGLTGGGPLWIDDSFGIAAQAGFDYMINRNWGFNADIKYIGMTPSARFVTAGLKSDVAINPIVFGVGLTYRFGGSNAVVAKY
jgi:outer membrane protein